GPAAVAQLDAPTGVTVTSSGDVLVADSATHTVRRIDGAGTITTIAGTPNANGARGDGGPATAPQLHTPQRLSAHGGGNVFIADLNNNRIRRIDTAGTITTVAGTGAPGNSGDEAPATSAQLRQPAGVLAAPDGSLYIADFGNHRIRVVDAAGVIHALA